MIIFLFKRFVLINQTRFLLPLVFLSIQYYRVYLTFLKFVYAVIANYGKLYQVQYTLASVPPF